MPTLASGRHAGAVLDKHQRAHGFGGAGVWCGQIALIFIANNDLLTLAQALFR
jgi:hypothetical protein